MKPVIAKQDLLKGQTVGGKEVVNRTIRDIIYPPTGQGSANLTRNTHTSHMRGNFVQTKDTNIGFYTFLDIPSVKPPLHPRKPLNRGVV